MPTLGPSRPKPQLGDGNLPTLWEAWGKPLSGIGGGRYRLTAHYLYFERGTLRTDSQQVPVSALHDIDVRQSMSQKARGLGTIVVHINRGSHMEMVHLVDIPNYREGQHAINDAAAKARLALQEQRNTSKVRYEGVPPTNLGGPSASSSAQAAEVGPDYVGQLEQLAKLRDNGIRTEEEFAAKKADILSRM
jgi:Bacterial PH domain/Short C-terminal domain